MVKKLTRAEFERLIMDLVEKTIEPCRIALDGAGVKHSDINEVILVGGSTRIPLVQQKVEEFYGRKPAKNINPERSGGNRCSYSRWSSLQET